METKTAVTDQLIKQAKDGDLVELVLREYCLPKLEEHFVEGSYIRMVIRLNKVDNAEGHSIKSVVGYWGQWFMDRKADNIEAKHIIIYPMANDTLRTNGQPPIRIEIPISEIISYEITKKGRRSVRV